MPDFREFFSWVVNSRSKTCRLMKRSGTRLFYEFATAWLSTGTAAPPAIKENTISKIVSPGVPFSLEIVGDNLEEYEKGILFTAFDLISQGFGSLGGNVSRGTGRIKIAVTEIEILNTQKLFQQYKNNGKIET